MNEGATEHEIDIISFRTGRNSHLVRVEDHDMPVLAKSFIGAPFLRNHDESDIGSRDGTVIDSLAETVEDGVALRQRVRVTTERGMRSLAEGQIDRFSISFDVSDWRCSVCGRSWFECDHWPGNTYAVNGEAMRCELIAVEPRGREVSAVNVPAVAGTGLLVELCDSKRVYQKGRKAETMSKGNELLDEQQDEQQDERQGEQRREETTDSGLSLATLRQELASLQA